LHTVVDKIQKPESKKYFDEEVKKEYEINTVSDSRSIKYSYTIVYSEWVKERNIA
jgi:hypothetical protein